MLTIKAQANLVLLLLDYKRAIFLELLDSSVNSVLAVMVYNTLDAVCRLGIISVLMGKLVLKELAVLVFHMLGSVNTRCKVRSRCNNKGCFLRLVVGKCRGCRCRCNNTVQHKVAAECKAGRRTCQRR